jgi:uncharacterized membrane protein
MFTLGVRMNHDPGLRSSFLRYRTKSSIRNDETWVYANLFAGRCLMILSVIVLIVLILSETFLLKHPTRMFVTLFFSLLIEILITFMLTERKMKSVFFKDGKRKPNSY